jgi:FkbM family methyltransferase
MPVVKNFLKRIYRRIVPARAEDAFRIAVRRLRPGDVVIDCGANVGDYTLLLAASGATVHAYEPDPVAFDVLSSRLKNFPNVHLHQLAVSNAEGIAKLFLHTTRELDPLKASTGSSLVATKTNIDPNVYVQVGLTRLSDVVEKLGPIRMMKMDIEGHEIEVINDLIETGAIKKIDRLFVELHDRKNPQLVDATQALRENIRRAKVRADLNWH